MTINPMDRAIINRLQDGLPICDRPFAEIALQLGLPEDELVARVGSLREAGVLSRFGPLFNAERMGGGLTLAAMQVPAAEFERVAGIVNGFPEVAHNYERGHSLNMWFVLATETPDRVGTVIAEIERATGLPVHNMPRIAEYFIGLRFEA